MKRVVITGLGVVSPIGTGRKMFLEALQDGRSGIKHFPELGTLNFECQIGGIPETDNSPFLSTLEKYNLAKASSTILYAALAGLEAWADAGLVIPDYYGNNTDPETGIIIGSGIGSMDIISDSIIPMVRDGKIRKIRSHTIEQLLFSASGAILSGILGTGNISTSNSNACATGTEAILLAFDLIRQGKATRMLAGSTEGYSPYYWAAFDALRVTATGYNKIPEKGSRPMSASATGMVPAAGAGILILEEMDSALSRNANIYAEVAGGHLNSGGQRNGGSMTAPNPLCVVKCINSALEDARIMANEIDCISGHLSSTMADVIEIRNWTEALERKNKDFPYINSLKSMTGHCLGAAGAVETIAAVLEIKNKFIHPSINCEDIHPQISELISVEKIPNTCMNNMNISVVAKSSFGFGDVNSCIILKEFKK